MILFKLNIPDIPNWLKSNTHYLTLMGSEAYGCETNKSDKDYYGICIPPVHYIFPHINGLIEGFDNIQRFESWQKHHILSDDKKKNYDIQIFSIVKFFNLCENGNPNIIDSLFTTVDCVNHITTVGHIIKDNRKEFLSKKCWPSFRGYAYSQYKKLKGKEYQGKRKEIVEKDPEKVDRKFLYHTIRLLLEAEQILLYKDIDLRRDREIYKAIRAGGISLDELENMIQRLLNDLDKKFAESIIPNNPNHEKLKTLLMECLESHYGKIDNIINIAKTDADIKLSAIRDIING